jgi:hypothetical protein
MSSIYNYVYDKLNYVAEICGYLSWTHLWQVNYKCMHAYCHQQSQDTQFKDNQCVYNTGTFVEVISSPWKSDQCGDDICSTAKMSETRVYVPPVYM